MTIIKTIHENFTTLLPSGELDANSSIYMDEAIVELITKGVKQIHIDCQALEYISSAGLGVFISHMDELSNLGGKFVFSQMRDNVSDVFNVLGLNQIFIIVSSFDEVIAAF